MRNNIEHINFLPEPIFNGSIRGVHYRCYRLTKDTKYAQAIIRCLKFTYKTHHINMLPIEYFMDEDESIYDSFPYYDLYLVFIDVEYRSGDVWVYNTKYSDYGFNNYVIVCDEIIDVIKKDI